MNEIMENFIQDFCQKVKEIFQERVVFLGLQGSVGRGESVDTSDIDLVVILDQLEIEDLVQYRNLIDQTPEPGRMCGFISGVNELYHWEKSDLFHFIMIPSQFLGVSILSNRCFQKWMCGGLY
jgi:hypothetical protein